MVLMQDRLVHDECLVAIDEIRAASDSESAQYLQFSALPLNSWRYRYVKRAFDVVVVLIMGIVFLIPFILIAIANRLTSRYPIFYNEERIGRNGVPFRIWKFRSMRPHTTPQHVAGADAEGIVLQLRMNKKRFDPRVTSVGGFLRRWSLDEMPQLFNVLRGDMSIIGPRPVVKAETCFYEHLLPFYLAATPGLSGLWQVSGRSNLDFNERARLDAHYAQSWSLRVDLTIFLRTIPTVLQRVGAR
jgi:lipopolysaccharide/colanic/teichoic acid biosynthesis glycosyltransferase